MAKLVEGVDYELTTFTELKRDCQYITGDDLNEGYEYGINWLSDGEVVDVSWFKTIEERQQSLDEEILQK